MVEREALGTRLTITPFFPDPDAPQLQAPLSVFVQQAAAAKMIGWDAKLNSQHFLQFPSIPKNKRLN